MALELGLTGLVLLAAFLHATWNALVKGEPSQLRAYVLLNLAAAAPATVLLLSVPGPAAESWRYLAASGALQLVYYVFLFRAYRWGDLSQVYPLARGSAPLLVAVGSALYAGEALDSLRAAGVALVSLGIGSLALGRARGGARPVLYALATGAAIAAYTVVDALGVRQSGSALGYIGWIFIANAVPTVLVLPFAWRLVPGPGSGRLVLGGLMVFGSYGLVIWALSLGAMASVAALRETSVLIAAAIGSILLGEPFGPRRIAASAFVALGLVLLNLRA